MLKKFMAATGVVAAGVTGAMLFGGPANADAPYAKHRAVAVAHRCYHYADTGAYHLDWCRRHHPYWHHGWYQGRYYDWYLPYYHRHGYHHHR